MKNVTLLFLLVCFFFGLISNAQQVISTSGTTFQNQSCTVSFTVGETIIGNLQNSTCLVSQGFQQSWINPVGVFENSAETNIGISPNPASNTIHINGLKTDQNVEIIIMNIHGNIEIIASAFKEPHLDVTSLSKGFYIVQIKSGETRFIEKLIIE